jgi:hypothetical protein
MGYVIIAAIPCISTQSSYVVLGERRDEHVPLMVADQKCDYVTWRTYAHDNHIHYSSGDYFEGAGTTNQERYEAALKSMITRAGIVQVVNTK